MNPSPALDPEIIPYGDTGLLIEFGNCMDRDVSRRVLQLNEQVLKSDLSGLIETVPTFHSLLVRYNPLAVGYDEIEKNVSTLFTKAEKSEESGRLWHLPVCYEAEYAPDLREVAERLDLTENAFVDLHCSLTHHVYMVGFLAGCPYMGDLPDSLSLARRSDPRVRVPKGSVAIALNMTVIYPLVSPGGWHLIGKTPYEIFDARWQQPALFSPGDQIEFQPVSAEEFNRIENAVRHEGHNLEPVNA